MNQTVNGKSPVRVIKIKRVEGSLISIREGNVTLADWANADREISRMARTAPNSGGYDKTEIAIEWENGEKLAFRLDMKRDTVSLRPEVWQLLRFYAGVQCPLRWTIDHYKRFLADNAQAYTEACRILETCDIGE